MTAKTLSEFMEEIEIEAEAEGPEAVEQLRLLRAHFRGSREFSEAGQALKRTQTTSGTADGSE